MQLCSTTARAERTRECLVRVASHTSDWVDEQHNNRVGLHDGIGGRGAVDAKINAEEALAVLPLAIKGDTEAVHTMESGTFDSVCV